MERTNIRRAAAAALLLAACGSEREADSPQPSSRQLAGNRIANASVEAGDGTPSGWHFLADEGVDGTSLWSTEAADGARSLHTEIAAGSPPGHARWWFDPVELQGGRFYRYTDLRRSWGRGRLILSCERDDGTRTFRSAWQSDSAAAWTPTTFRFYLPHDCAVTVMHVLDHPGFLQTDAHELREVEPAPLQRPLVSITFDDGAESDRTVAAPALEARGMRGSFYVVSGWLGRDGFLDADGVRDLAEAGHEIGSHAASHQALPEVAVHELRDEIEGSLRQLAPLGAAGGLAYPFGEFDEVVEAYAATQARYVRTSLFGLNDATVDPLRIRIHPVTTATTTEELRGAIDDAERTSTWLVLLFHALGTETESDPYTTSAEQFVEVLDHLDASGIAVVPVIEALEEIGR